MLLIDGVKYEEWTDLKETEDLEPMIQKHAKYIFGENALYIDRKQKLRSLAGTGSIPDAYVISLGGDSPHWHIVEIELSYKDPGRHLVTQINDFINGMKNSRNVIVSAINQWIKSDNIRALEFKRRSLCEDIHEFLSDLIKKDPILTIIIEKNTEKLKEAIQIFKERYKTEIVEFRTFRRVGAEAVHAHLFEPVFQAPSKLITTIEQKAEVITTRKLAGEVLAKRATVKNLIDANILKVGQVIYGWHENKRYEGAVLSNGDIAIVHTGEVFDSPSGAASHIRGYQEDGWRWWYTTRESGKECKLGELREEYRATHP